MDQVLGFRFICPPLIEASTAKLTISCSYLLFTTLLIIRLYVLFVIVSFTDCLLLHFTKLPSTKVSFWVAVSVFSGSSMFSRVIAVRGSRLPQSGKSFVFLGTNDDARLIRSFWIVGGPGVGGAVFLRIGGVRRSVRRF